MKVVVIGGGFSGLSCATDLAGKEVQVVVVEARNHLGGRAFSYRHSGTGETVDNGQHLFMGCYRQTLAFLERIGSRGLMHFPPRLDVPFVGPGGAGDRLRCPSFFRPPWHIVAGIFMLKSLSLIDKFRFLRIGRFLRRARSDGALSDALDRMTVAEWLRELGQGNRVGEKIIYPLAVSALNEDPAVASALGLAQVLREVFFSAPDSCRLGWNAAGLSELYVIPSERFIHSRGGRVVLGDPVRALEVRGSKVTAAVLRSGERLCADYFVSAVPPWELGSFLPGTCGGILEQAAQLRSSPIVSICFWLDREVFSEPLAGLWQSEFHWIFNGRKMMKTPPPPGERLIQPGVGGGGATRVSLVLSGAHRQVKYTPKALYHLAVGDLSTSFPAFRRAAVVNWSVRKELRAGISPGIGSDAFRPGHDTPVENLLMAGDWTQTGLPATIESAVRSGHACAGRIAARGRC